MVVACVGACGVRPENSQDAISDRTRKVSRRPRLCTLSHTVGAAAPSVKGVRYSVPHRYIYVALVDLLHVSNHYGSRVSRTRYPPPPPAPFATVPLPATSQRYRYRILLRRGHYGRVFVCS